MRELFHAAAFFFFDDTIPLRLSEQHPQFLLLSGGTAALKERLLQAVSKAGMQQVQQQFITQMPSAVCSFRICISCFSMQTDLPYCLVWAVPNWILILFLCMTAIPARFCKTMQKPFATAMQNYKRMRNTLCSCNRQQNRRSLISVP